MKQESGVKSNNISWKYILASIGPGLILAATTIGPGSVVTSTNTGANFGYSLLWWFVFILILRALFSLAMNRYAVVTGKPIMKGILDNYGPVWAGLAGIFAFIGQVIYGIGNFLGAGMGLNILFPFISIKVAGIISMLICITLLFLKNLYKKIEKFMSVLVSLMIVIFIIALIMSGGRQEATETSIVPSIPVGSMAIMLSLLGTTSSLGTCAYGSSLVIEKGYTSEDIKKRGMQWDVIAGVVSIGIISISLMFLGANLLSGNPIKNGMDLANALSSTVGDFIRPIFGLGFFAASISSQLMAPKLGINLLLQAFDKEYGMENKTENVVTVFMLIFAAIVALAYGGVPARLLTLAQIGGVINTPILGIMTILLVNKEKEMGQFKISKANTIALAISYVFVMVTVINNLINIVKGLLG